MTSNETTNEYKVINKQIMVERRNSLCSWSVTANIFELVKSYLLWNYSKEFIPHSPPYINEDHFRELSLWYLHLSKPCHPIVRTLKVTEEECRLWLNSLDLSKKFDKALCDEIFIDAFGGTPKREVDEIAITEAENEQ